MKNIKIAILSLAMLGSVSSCRDHDFGDDYNKNKYGQYNASYKSLMAGAFMNFGRTGGTTLMNPILYVQYQSQLVYTDESQYGFARGAWSVNYINQVKNLNTIIEDYSNNPTNSMLQTGSAENMIGLCRIFRGIVLKRVTDSFGDVPYSEILKSEEGIYTPKYDSQEEIYKQIVKDLKEGRDMIGVGLAPEGGDPIYKGDMAKWKKLANSVLLQATLQLSETSLASWAKTEFNNALNDGAGLIETPEDEAWFEFSTSSLFTNPLNRFRAADYALSAELTESMKGSANSYNRTSNTTPDFRLFVYSNDGTNGSGIPYGYSQANLPAFGSSNTKVSTYYNEPESPISLMTASYTYLNRAEAAAKGWTTESASSMLQMGIYQSYKSLETKHEFYVGQFADLYATNYINARLANAGTSSDMMKQVIGEEKWVSLFMNGHNAWSEFRRTGYPNLLPATDAVNSGAIPTRFPYPTNEASYNTSNYNQGVSTLSPAEDKNTSKVWWDQ